MDDRNRTSFSQSYEKKINSNSTLNARVNRRGDSSVSAGSGEVRVVKNSHGNVARSKKASMRRRRRNMFFRCVFAFVMFIVAVSMILCTPIFSIRDITISGNVALDGEYLRERLSYLQGMNAFSSNKGSLIEKYLFNFDALEKDFLSKNGCVSSVDIKYSLGGALKVNVKEAFPVAVAEIGGGFFLIDREWVVVEESSSNPIEENIATSKVKKGKQNKKNKKPEEEKQVSTAPSKYNMENVVLISGLAREDIFFDRTKKEKSSNKQEILEDAWRFMELNISPLREKHKVVKMEVDELFVIYTLKSGLRVKIGNFSTMTDEEIDYKAMYLQSVLDAIPDGCNDLLDMFSGENIISSPAK